jgi:hypothetical protein
LYVYISSFSQLFITSSSTLDLSSALPGAPDVVPHLIPIPISPISKILMDIDAANLTTTTPLHSSPFEPVASHANSPQGTTEVSTPNVNGPFRIYRDLSSGGSAKAVGVQDKASGRFLCLKAFRKDRLQQTYTSLLNELAVYKRLASSKECCPATTFLMELEMSFQTAKYVCFAMVCASSLCAI